VVLRVAPLASEPGLACGRDAGGTLALTHPQYLVMLAL